MKLGLSHSLDVWSLLETWYQNLELQGVHLTAALSNQNKNKSCFEGA